MKPALRIALACLLWSFSTLSAQVAPRPSHVVIPMLANATKPDDLDFQGGECDIDTSGTKMDCVFQQAFLTTSSIAPDTCLITTNRYQRTFRRENAGGRNPAAASSARWVSTEGPEGDCGLLDVATLQYDGGIRWTLETRKVASRKTEACRALEGQSETLSWQNLRRPLPCKFVQPGGLQ